MERLGPFELLDRMMLDGLGETHRAVVRGPSGAQKLVAIKCIHPHRASKDSVARRVSEAARLVSKLDHPNLLSVVEPGLQGNTLFVVTEYVAGQRLSHVLSRSILTRRRLPLGFVLYVVQHVLQGLACVHQHLDGQGNPLAHGDIHPQNIILSHEGTVHLADVGLAHAAGLVQGPISKATDLHAMGVVLYEMLALRSTQSTSSATPHGPIGSEQHFPPIECLCPYLPPEVCALVNRAVARDPASCFPSAEAFGQAVHELAVHLGQMWNRDQAQVLMSQWFFHEIERERRCRAHYLAEPLAPQKDTERASAGKMRRVTGHGVAVERRPAVAVKPDCRERTRVKPMHSCKPLLLGAAFLCGLATLTASSVSMATHNPPSSVQNPIPASTPEPGMIRSREAPPEPVPLPVVIVPVSTEQEAPPPVASTRVQRGARKGWLTVQSKPCARVIIDGKDTKMLTPLNQFPVSSGTHRVVLINDELSKRASFSFTIKPGAELVHVVDLE